MLQEILKDQHILLLPTLNENFGHVIIESFQHGCPVIISDNTPWRQLKSKKIGYDINLDKKDNYIKAIDNFARMNFKTFNEWSISAYNFGSEFTKDHNLVKNVNKLFRS